jgi:chemotaxis protein MotB
MRSNIFYPFICLIAVLSCVSCVSTGKYKAMQQEAQKNDSLYIWSMRTLKTCQDANTDLGKQKGALQDQANNLELLMTATKENNTQLRKQLQDLSTLSSAQAESIKRSFDNMSAKDSYIMDLQAALKHRDSVNLAVLMNLKVALGSFGEDVNIKLDKGEVHVDLADRLLFNSDSNSVSYMINDKAKAVLGRLARVLNEQPDIEFMVEGNTDSLSLSQDTLLDSWDLSVKRATSVVRLLQNNYSITPMRMTAAGRGEYLPVTTNDTSEGRMANRHTRIIILPQLDPLLRLLEHRQGQGGSPAPAAATAVSGS